MYWQFFQLDNTVYQLGFKIINILWSEISAEYHLLSTNDRFCHLKQKAIVLI